MSKKVGVHFWSIFDRYEDSKIRDGESPGQEKKSKVKDFLKKAKDTEAEIIVYADDYTPSPSRIEGRVPEFQKEIIKAAMEERMKQGDIPFDETTISKPKDTDIDISYKVTEHKNWESVLLDKLKKNGD